jgi:anaerobic dimethyl sulfoxide reductase subunit A
MFGGDYGRSGFDAATMEDSGLIVLWGANILETRLGAELPSRLVRAQKRGVPVIMIDPRYTKTAKALKAKWIGIQPGTDRALMYGLLHEIIGDSRFDKDFVYARSIGFPGLEDFILGKIDGISRDASWASRECGIQPSEIKYLAELWLQNKPVMLIPGYSIQRVLFGEETFRLTVAIQLATKNLGISGGSSGSINNRLPFPSVGLLSRRTPYAQPEFPILRWPDAILKGRPEYPIDIHGAYVAGSNFLNQGADIAKNVRAFEKLDFSVCHEMFMTPTARYCDVVLPVASPLQKEDIGIPWAGNYLLYKPKILPCESQERSDYDIFLNLSAILGVEQEFSEGKNESQWINEFLSNSDIPDPDAFKACGIYFGDDQTRVGLKDFAFNPQPNPLATKSGKIEFESPLWHDDGWKTIMAIAETREHGKNKTTGEALSLEFPLSLMSTKTVCFVHSQGGQVPEKILKNELMMNSRDARARKIRDGELVVVESAIGKLTVIVRFSDSIVSGVVNLPEGFWFSPDESGFDEAGSANVLTSTEGTRESISCVLNAIPVEVRSYDAWQR